MRDRDRYARVALHNTRVIAVVLATAYLPIKCRRVKTNQPNDSGLQALQAKLPPGQRRGAPSPPPNS